MYLPFYSHSRWMSTEFCWFGDVFELLGEGGGRGLFQIEAIHFLVSLEKRCPVPLFWSPTSPDLFKIFFRSGGMGVGRVVGGGGESLKHLHTAVFVHFCISVSQKRKASRLDHKLCLKTTTLQPWGVWSSVEMDQNSQRCKKNRFD